MVGKMTYFGDNEKFQKVFFIFTFVYQYHAFFQKILRVDSKKKVHKVLDQIWTLYEIL